MILGVQDVYYNVADMDRAVTFYRDVLGLTFVHRDAHWASFDVGGVRVGLHWSGGEAVPPVPHDEHGALAGATLTLKVDDVRAESERLIGHGVRFLAPVSEFPWGTLGAFFDPDGNVVKLMQPAERM
jgi:predicted enzyme related to lactoylglutathione lyase